MVLVLQDEGIAVIYVQWMTNDVSFATYNRSLVPISVRFMRNLKLGAANLGAISREIFEGDKAKVVTAQMKQSWFRDKKLFSVL